ncbi:MAG: hypothetical protein U0559_09205 [Anaerolineae bacterium]
MLQSERERPIAVVGDSVIMTAVEATLTDRLMYTVCRFDPHAPEAAATLAQLKPRSLIFDLESPEADRLMPLLQGCPNLLSIGLNLNRSSVVLMSSQRLTLNSLDDLIRVIQLSAEDCPAESQAQKEPKQ